MKMELQDKDEINLGTLNISLNKLRKKLRESEIEKLYQTFLRNKQQSNGNDLFLVPSQVLPSVLQSKAQKFDMQQIYNQDLSNLFEQQKLRQFNNFVHIKFTNLTILNLSNQLLNSLQPLGFLDAPKLRCLQFHDTDITNLNALVKAEFPRLEIITFYHNPITQIEKFCRFHSKRLTGYEFDNKKTYKNRVEDFRFLFKMENPIPKMIKAQDDKRIDISKRKSYKILNQPGTKILINIPRMNQMPQRLIQRQRFMVD